MIFTGDLKQLPSIMDPAIYSDAPLYFKKYCIKCLTLISEMRFEVHLARTYLPKALCSTSRPRLILATRFEVQIVLDSIWRRDIKFPTLILETRFEVLLSRTDFGNAFCSVEG